MIVGIGIDVVENRRMERELARGAWQVADSVFTAREIRRCAAASRPERQYAACFAAKEATLKALAAGAGDCGRFGEIEVARSRRGEKVVLHRRARAAAKRLGVKRIKISTCVSAETAAALVVLES